VSGKLTAEAREQNLAVGRSLLEAYEQQGPWGVYERYDEFFHPDFSWTPAVSQLGEQVYVGREGMRQWIKDMEAVATEFRQTEIEVRAVGDRHLLGLGRMHLVGKESGAPFESEYGSVYEVEDGRAVSGSAYLSHAEAERRATEAARDPG
jgi:ketosteroid isomerase-like protein